MINKRYIINKKIGEGRSKVFSVIDTEFPERIVAAKILSVSASAEEKQTFIEEFFTLQKLEHPNILKAFELSTIILIDDEEDNEIEKFSLFITMEYFPATDVLNHSKLSEEKYLNLFIKQLCSVLYYLHQSNYVYYDLKPENILVSNGNGQPVIKLIDFGFARKVSEEVESNITGTPYYLAPELLKNQPHDYRVDFYSLGILLYRIVYGKLPFSAKSEIEIYKAHIEEEFVFEESKYSPALINVISKLLKKNPLERYNNALQILTDLQVPIDFEITKDFGPAKIFSDRKDAINILGSYLKDKNSNEVFSVNGFDGSGKSSLLQEIYHKNQNSVLVENTMTKTGIDSIKYIFRKLVLTETIYSYKESEFNQIINDLYEKSDSVFIDTIKRVFNTLPAGINFIVLLDDYNLYDTFTTETLTEIIRILQVKGIKVILSESADFDQSSSALNNLCMVQLNQFTEHQLSEFVDLSYSNLFPQDELKKIILLYSDLLPGSIKQFIKDLILLKVIKYNNALVSFETNEEIILTLQSSHEELYRIRLSNLNNRELKLAQLISAFEISIEQTVLSALMDLPADVLKNSLNELEKKNVIETLNISNAPKINSFNFNKYIYSTISNRTKFHLILANSIKKLFADFNIVELSRQYEVANEFEKSAEILAKEIERAEEIHAYSYKKTLLEKLLKLSLPERISNKLSVDLVKTLFKLSDYKNTLDYFNKIKIEVLPESEQNELIFVKGSSLIEYGKIKEGIDTLNKLKTQSINKTLLHKIIITLAYAESDSNNYPQAEEYCLSLINDKDISAEDLGRVNNLMAIIEFNFRNNLKKSFEYSFEALKHYQSAKLPRRVAGMYVNIGAIYDMVGDKKEAENYWQKALEVNSSIGNLEQEGAILINYGVLHHNSNSLEKAIECWKQAINIFIPIGIQNKLAFAKGNMGEVYFIICDYQNAYESLILSYDLFKSLNNDKEGLSTLLILGKFWFTIGDVKELNKIINNYEVTSLVDIQKSDKSTLNLLYLRLLKNLLFGTQIINETDVLQLLEGYLAIEEKNLYLETIYNYSEYLIKTNKLIRAHELLSLKTIDKIIEQNIIFTAQRLYLFGKIAQVDQSITDIPAIQCFEKAYNLLEGESITELTWKVLFEISNTYFERGNFYKSKQPRIYAYELINLIGDNISNTKIRSAFFNHPERKRALDKLAHIGNQAQFNEYQKS
jgi:serine/threonine protein kinase